LTIDDDILLLDISNNDLYIWTNIFDPIFDPKSLTTSETSMTPTTTRCPLTDSDTTNPTPLAPIISGAIIGSLIGGILLSFGVYLYKCNKNKQRQRNDDDYNHGRESIPNADNQGLY